jgi:hypothetical protein
MHVETARGRHCLTATRYDPKEFAHCDRFVQHGQVAHYFFDFNNRLALLITQLGTKSGQEDIFLGIGNCLYSSFITSK